MTPLLITPKEAAEILRFKSVTSIHNLIAAKELPAIPIRSGKKTTWRIEEKALDSFIKARRQTA